MNDTVMAGEVQSQKTKAFASRSSTSEERIKRDEEELEQLLEEQEKGKAESTEEKEEDIEAVSPEDKSFKKRYGDLRRHTQQKENELQSRISALEKQLTSSTKSEIKLPKSDEDIEAWAKDYPDVAAIIETIAIKKAREQSADLEERVKEIDEMKASASKDKAQVELMQFHPDFDKIREDDDFHTWAEEQPRWIQEALYDNDNDARSAARAIDLYKSDRGITTKKPSTDKDAARSINTRADRSKPQEGDSKSNFRESQVAKMSSQEYEKKADEIMESIRTGKFIYDISGNAR
jgi:hypothetical protein|tara:strand:+ start:55 stop:930 length:876 start_codon:yes stop_codon:yes gene_type:complete